jgi:hypothetical protein
MQFSKRCVFLVSRIPDDGQSPKNPVILKSAHIFRKVRSATTKAECHTYITFQVSAAVMTPL